MTLLSILERFKQYSSLDITILLIPDFFTPALVKDLSLGFDWQQVSLSLKDSSQ